MKLLHDTGLQVAVHVGGDQGIDMTLTAFEEALESNPRKDPRHRIEHCLFPSKKALARMKKANIILSTSPQWMTWHGDMYQWATDDKAMEDFMPLKTALRMGIPVAFGCDVPASIYQEPKWAFAGPAMRRSKAGPLNQAERLTIQEALRVHTMGSAYAGFAEETTGSLESGKFADMLVRNHVLYHLTRDQILELQPEMTILGGQIVYEKAKSGG